MKNNYKQILVTGIISFCCSITHLNADLLNGPYSPESQELVKILKDKKLPIPTKFKEQEKEIEEFRQKVMDAAGITGPGIRFDSSVYTLAKNNTAFLEAIIQYYKSPEIRKAILERFKIYGFIPQEVEIYSDPLFQIALFSREINNIDLFTTSIATVSQQIINALFLQITYSLFRNNEDRLNPEYNKRVHEVSQRRYDFDINLINILTKKTDNKSRSLVLFETLPGSTENDYIEDVVNFILQLGADINILKNNKTILDQVYSKLDINIKRGEYKNYGEQNKVYYEEQNKIYKEIINSLKKNIAFLKSKGAKTYAELTVTNGNK